MLGELGATLWPPTSWEEILENKDQIYTKFNKFMLRARWVKLDAVQGSVEKLAAGLLSFCRLDGEYFIKGSLSCAKTCGTSVKVVGGRCPELVEILRKWVDEMHQRCVGIQSFMPGFDRLELRTWLVPDSVARRWRPALTIKTELLPTGLSAELYQPLHGAGLRVAQLVDEMLAEHAPFFEQLRQMGIPALRVDCGYDSASEKAFFNEFAAVEAWIWSEVHGQDLAAVVGRGLGDSVWAKLLNAAP